MATTVRKTRITWNEPGHAHFVTYSCVNRLRLLTTDRSRRWVVAAMEDVRRTQEVAIWAYVIMPDHVHLLLYPRREQYEMRKILAALKFPVSRAARAYLRQTGQTEWMQRLTVRYPSRTVFRFWQPGGGFDRNLREEASVAATTEYIHNNPVRSKLVKEADDWYWSSARFWAGHADVPVRMDDPVPS